MKNSPTIIRKHPRSNFCGQRVLTRRVQYLLALVILSPVLVESFGINTSPNKSVKADTRGETSLSVTTLVAPPPDHMAWLQSQDELERCQTKHKNLRHDCQKKRGEKSEVGLLKKIEKTSALCMSNATTKEAWAASFTTVEGLRESFGRNRNNMWGDLDPQATRRLYKAVLQRALLELNGCLGTSNENLAPLAYRARVTAKKYARERSVLPARIGAILYDGFRQYRKYGKFQATGMSYPQVWEKYASQIIQEKGMDNEQDFISAVCYKILQKFCETNKRVDNLFLAS